MVKPIKKIAPSMLISLLIISTLATFGVQISRVMGSPGLLTGRIFDKGIDKDSDGFFDYLEIKVEVDITTAGVYIVGASTLKDGITYPYSSVYVYDSIQLYLNVGVQNVPLSFYGPTIRASGKTNLGFVYQVYIRSYESDDKFDLALSRRYSYLEFDAAFSNEEAVFKIFPNGTVDIAGLINADPLSYPARGEDISLSVAISHSGGLTTVSTSGKIVAPWWLMTAWPLNASTGGSMSLTASYMAGLVKGSATFHLLSGVPLGDLTLNFEANKYQLTATGSVTVIYGTYPLYPNPITLNDTTVDSYIAAVVALEGTGPYTFYNMTDGFIEMSTASSITKTPQSGGARVDFNVIFDGDFIAYIAYIMSGEGTQPPMQTFVTEVLTNIYVEVKSAEVSITYQNGQADFQATIVFQDDFNREITYIKRRYVDAALQTTLPGSEAPLLIMNATGLDFTNLKATYRITEDTGFLSFEALRTSPPIDPIDATSFKLYRFFNITTPTSPYSRESPGSGEKLKLTAQGGNNGTHILTLIRPPTVPAPDYVSGDQTVMVWNNQSISSLKNLKFSLQSYTGVEWNGQTYPVITNSNGTVSPITLDQPNKKVSLTIDGPTGSVGYANITIPKALLYAPKEQWVIVVGSTTIVWPDYMVTETETTTSLYFTFTFSSPVSIQIIGAVVVPEFSPAIILLPFIVVSMLAVVLAKRRRFKAPIR